MVGGGPGCRGAASLRALAAARRGARARRRAGRECARPARSRPRPSACASWCSRTWSSAAFADADPRDDRGRAAGASQRSPRDRDERVDAVGARPARELVPPDRVVVATPGSDDAPVASGTPTGGALLCVGRRRAAQGTGHAGRGAGDARAACRLDLHDRRLARRAIPTSPTASRRSRRTPGLARARSRWPACSPSERARRARTSAPTCSSRRRARRATAWPSPTRCGAASRSSPAASAASRRRSRPGAPRSWCHRISRRALAEALRRWMVDPGLRARLTDRGAARQGAPPAVERHRDTDRRDAGGGAMSDVIPVSVEWLTLREDADARVALAGARRAGRADGARRRSSSTISAAGPGR